MSNKAAAHAPPMMNTLDKPFLGSVLADSGLSSLAGVSLVTVAD
jgi:hypothetical protein